MENDKSRLTCWWRLWLLVMMEMLLMRLIVAVSVMIMRLNVLFLLNLLVGLTRILETRLHVVEIFV